MLKRHPLFLEANMDEELVLCGASAYSKKFYLNEEFSALPEDVRNELKIMCVLFTEDVGGIIQFVFDEEGVLNIKTSQNQDDFLYDDIGAVLKVKELQRENADLFEQLETYYKVFFTDDWYEED